MANALYNDFKRALLNKEHNLSSDGIQASLVDAGTYTFAQTDTTYTTGTNGIPSAAKIAAFGPLTTPTIAAGVFDSDDFTWSSVSGVQSEDIVLWNNTPANKPLIAFYDTGMTGMPVTPNGGNINVTVNAAGWFSL